MGGQTDGYMYMYRHCENGGGTHAHPKPLSGAQNGSTPAAASPPPPAHAPTSLFFIFDSLFSVCSVYFYKKYIFYIFNSLWENSHTIHFTHFVDKIQWPSI